MFRQLTKKITVALAIIICAIGAMSQASQIVLRTTDGRAFNLDDNRGAVTVLLFSATWVPMTDRELPAFQRLANLYAGRDIDFYWVSIDSAKKEDKRYASDADLQVFADELELRLPVLRDPDRNAFRALGLDALPAIVIIDREGQVSCTVIGFGPYWTRTYGPVIRCLNQLLANGT
jgi:peroxiredoxin